MTAASAAAPARVVATPLAWAAGGAAACGCLDLLVAVLLALDEAPARAALAPAAAIAAYLSLALAAAGFARPRGALPVVAALHAVLAVGAGWWMKARLGGAVPWLLVAAAAAHALAAVAAAFGAAAARRAPGESVGAGAREGSGATAENLESILVAIVFALVIRHFAVEAYKIPTGSMAPTLLGNDPRRGSGDRVLVLKGAAATDLPGRYEIWVFRFPLDRATNYVKRVAGLPGESLSIEDGDLYADGKVTRKPERTREEMWFPVHPAPGAPATGAAATTDPWTGEGYRKDGTDGYRVEGAPDRRLLRFGLPVRDGVLGSAGSESVGDVRVRFELERAEPGTEVLVRLVGRAGPCEVVLGEDGGLRRIEPGPPPTAAEARGAGRPGEVEVSFADLLLEVRVDGDVVARRECTALPPGDRPRYSVAFGVEKGGATFRAPRLDRDVFYTARGRTKFDVPAGCYVFLGDNSPSSEDSRAWKGVDVRDTAPGGGTFRARARPSPSADGATAAFVDVEGTVHRVPAEGWRERWEVTTVDAPFVPAEDLQGRAFAIFWPPRWASNGAGRLRLLP